MIRRVGSLGAVIAFTLLGWGASAALTAKPVFACDTTAPSTTCTPDALATSPSSTFVQRQTGTLNSCSGTITTCFTASYIEEVYRDPSNVFCTNCLDWLIQVTDNTVPTSDTADPISTITIGDFKNFRTDAGTDMSALPAGSQLSAGGTATPSQVFRRPSPANGVLGWSFGTPGTPIIPGQTTVILDVMTNATQVIPGQISAQDQSANTQPGLAPTIPEAPIVVAFLGAGGLAGLIVRRRWRKGAAAAQ